MRLFDVSSGKEKRVLRQHGVEVHEMNLPTVVQAIHRLQERHAARTRKIVAVAG